MKRWEMIEIIEKELNDFGDYFPNNQLASLILKQIEEAGMVPPPPVQLKKTGAGCLCTMREDCVECNPYSKFYENKWED
jgi:hypothetical protein